VVHFWDPACPCNVGNQQHLGDLVQFAGGSPSVLQKPGSHGQLRQPRALKPSHLPGSEHLPVPRRGHLGPARRPGLLRPLQRRRGVQPSNSFIEPILKALLDGRQVSASNTLAVGCYCPWAG
jgi:hypothetical protein